MNDYKIPQEEQKISDYKLFNFRPLFFSAVFFVLGIIVACLCKQYILPHWLLLCALPIAGLPFCFAQSKRDAKLRAIAVGVLIACFSLGFLSFTLQTRAYQTTRHYNGTYTVQGKVVDYVESGTQSWVELTDIRIDGTREKGRLIAYLPQDYAFSVSLADNVNVVGKVQTDTTLFDGNGFRGYNVEKDLRYTMRVDDITVTGRSFQPFLWLRERIENVVRSGMDDTPAEVLLALLIGETSGMDRGVLENVRYGGIAHVFAVSGLHVGALFACLLFILQRDWAYDMPKLVRFLLASLFLLLYGGVCGFSASVTRAIVTCLCYYACKLIGTAGDTLEVISLACLVTTVGSPCTVFTVGYQLSFMACYGIALLSRRLEEGIWWIWGGIRKLFHHPVRVYLPSEQTNPPSVAQQIEKNCISFVSVTLSASAFTAPVQLVTFGYLSVWSFVLNCVFVPLIGVLFPCLLLITMLAVCLPIAWSFAVLYIPNVVVTLLTFLFWVVDFTRFSITGLGLNFWALACYYLALLFCTDKWNTTKRFRFALAIALGLSCIVATVLLTIV